MSRACFFLLLTFSANSFSVGNPLSEVSENKDIVITWPVSIDKVVAALCLSSLGGKNNLVIKDKSQEKDIFRFPLDYYIEKLKSACSLKGMTFGLFDENYQALLKPVSEEIIVSLKYSVDVQLRKAILAAVVPIETPDIGFSIGCLNGGNVVYKTTLESFKMLPKGEENSEGKISSKKLETEMNQFIDRVVKAHLEKEFDSD